MKDKLGVPKGRPLADFLPTITIKAKDFANEITNFNIKQNDLRTEPASPASTSRTTRTSASSWWIAASSRRPCRRPRT